MIREALLKKDGLVPAEMKSDLNVCISQLLAEDNLSQFAFQYEHSQSERISLLVQDALPMNTSIGDAGSESSGDDDSMRKDSIIIKAHHAKEDGQFLSAKEEHYLKNLKRNDALLEYYQTVQESLNALFTSAKISIGETFKIDSETNLSQTL